MTPSSRPSASTFRDSLRLLLTRRFGTFWLASLLSNIGTWAQQVAQPWLLLSLGASPWLLGLDSFAMGGPGLLLMLVGGVLADRADRRKLIAVLQSIQALCPVLIVVLLLNGSIQPWIIIVLSLVVGVTDALSMPSFQTIVASIVDRRQLPTGIALNTTQFNLSRILGPSLAGVLMASIGAVGAFAVSAASYVPFIAVALWILPRVTVQALGPTEGGGDGRLLAGAREVLRQPALRGAVLTVLVGSTLCSPLLTFCPVLVKSVFQADVAQYSLTVSAFGAGGLLGGLLLMAIDPRHDRRPLASWAATGFAGVVVASALNRWAAVLPLLFVLGGLSMTMANASANAWLQAQAPAAIRGQTVSLFMLAMRGGTALGGLVTGFTVSAWGVREALLLNGLLALAVVMGVRRVWLQAPLPASPT